MPIANFTLFLSITFVVSASPGPMMLSCMSNGGLYGVVKSLEGMLGASLGNLCLVALTALGLGLIVSHSDIILNTIKWLGALYLIYLGVQTIRQPGIVENRVASKGKSLWLSGFFIAISNPKGLIYFGALFPQFINNSQPLLWQLAWLTITFLLMDLFWIIVYAAAGQQIMAWLKTPKHQTLFNRISGLVLISAGLVIVATGSH